MRTKLLLGPGPKTTDTTNPAADHPLLRLFKARLSEPVRDHLDYEGDGDDTVPLFVRPGTTDVPRPTMRLGIIGGMSPLEDAIADQRLRTVREPDPVINFIV